MRLTITAGSLVASMALTLSSFDLPATSLEKNLGDVIDQLGWRPDAAAETQLCDSKSPGEISCNVVAFNVMFIASGTELPPQTTGIRMLLLYGDHPDSKKVSQAIVVVVGAYDASFLTQGFQTMRSGVIEGIATGQPRNYEGINANYRLEMASVPWDPKTTTPVLHVTPRQ